MFGIARLNTIAKAAAEGGGDSTWDISTASYASKSFSVGTQETQPNGLFFKSDGTAFYIVGQTNNIVYQYTLSTAWDMATASYASKSFSVSAQSTNSQGLFFKSDGTGMYVIDNTNDRVLQYTLSTAWDISTASYASKIRTVSAQNGFPQDVTFKTDGSAFYFVGQSIIYQYTVSTAWDIATASYASKSLDVSTQEAAARGIFFNPSGLQLFVVGTFTDTVYQYTLSTAWDISTASYASKSFSISSQEDISSSIFFRSDGKRMYIPGRDSQLVKQYNLT
jgi:hypothetical protein